MNAKKSIRQTHRWVSVVFTAISAAIFIAQALGLKPHQWIYFLPLLPLLLLVVTGLYMFVLPYAKGGKTTGVLAGQTN